MRAILWWLLAGAATVSSAPASTVPRWTQELDAGPAYWSTVASSASGSRLIAGSSGTAPNNDPAYVKMSSDYGATWANQTSLGLAFWSTVAASADGNYVVAAQVGSCSPLDHLPG